MGRRTLSRRDFLRAGAAAGSLLVAIRPARLAGAAATGGLSPNALLEVTAAGDAVVWLPRSEMGQGIWTGMPMMVAEELAIDWARVTVRQADLDPKYGNQTTGGSASVRRNWAAFRRAGAQAREMLVAEAAARWGVAAAECRAARGEVTHAPSGRRAAYGELVAGAATRPVPAAPRLTEPGEFTLIGTSPPRLEIPARVTGGARYGLDVRLPGMLFATLLKAPDYGGTLRRVDAAAARAVPGVRRIVELGDAVAVVAETTWAAMEGRRRLEAEFAPGPRASLSSGEIERMMRDRARSTGAIGRNDGDAPAALGGAARLVEAAYDLPFLAHVALEPMNCTARVAGGACTLWAPTQNPQRAREDVARALGVAPERVAVHVTLLGGGFGRRLMADYAVDAARVAQALDGAPVQVLWPRDEDVAHDWYRPVSHHRLAAALDSRGRPVAWFHRFAAPSIVGQQWPERVRNGYDPGAFDGADAIPYAIPNVRVEYGMLNTPVPVGWWRSVYASQHAFANESFVDELAGAAGQDPVAFRLALLADRPRERAVLELAARHAGWGTPLPAGRARGVALHTSFESHVAEVAEVSLEGGAVRVHRVVAAVDCGIAVHPNAVRAQVEGAIMDGLGAALFGEVTIEGGRAVERNFDRYRLLRLPEAPAVEVHLVPSREAPGGVGEPGLPPVAPAVANALAALTGERLRRLPILKALGRSA